MAKRDRSQHDFYHIVYLKLILYFCQERGLVYEKTFTFFFFITIWNFFIKAQSKVILEYDEAGNQIFRGRE